MFYGFGETYVFTVLAENCIFAVFDRKLHFWSFLLKTVFLQFLTEHCVFTVFDRTLCFYGFGGIVRFCRFYEKCILPFLRKSAFLQF